MSKKVTLEHAERLTEQLLPQEQLKLVARICERLSTTPAAMPTDAEQARPERLRLAEELLAEVEQIENDSQGESDAAATIRRMREARIAQICQSDA